MNQDELRQTVLQVVTELANLPNTALQASAILQESARRLGIRGVNHEQALLAFFNDLFRMGYLAWGHNLANPAPPFCHITDRGRAALATHSRDPSNPDGYLAHLHAAAQLNPIAESYIREALTAYGGGCFKATAVMVGAAAETLVIEIRDTLLSRLDALAQRKPPDLEDWRISRVLDTIEAALTAKRTSMPRPLAEAFESYWRAFTQQIRVARNAAGHPNNIDPVEETVVQAALLIFPELARLATELRKWILAAYH